MAGDLQFTADGVKFKGKGKIFKIKAHPAIYDKDFIVGMAGVATNISLVVEYFNQPDIVKPPKVKGVTGIILDSSGNIFTFDTWDTWLANGSPFAACGSGANIALGAMTIGATPKEAVKAAMQHDVYTGMGIQVLSFRK